MARRIKVTVALKHEQLAIEALCANYSRPEKIKNSNGEEVDNPVTTDEFANNVILSFIREHIKAYKANKASEQARLKAMQEVDSTIDLTESD